MTLAIGDMAPDFEAETTEGKVRFHDWLGNSWGVSFCIRKIYSRLHHRTRRNGPSKA